MNDNSQVIKFIEYALEIGALEFIPKGRKLKSGRLSPYFFNSGLFNSGESTTQLLDAYASVVYESGIEFDVVYGPAYKGISLAVAFSVIYNLYYKKNVGWAHNRKEEKDHGEGGTLVGSSLEEKKVLIIDDVMTSGTSVGEAIDFVEKKGGIPVLVVIGCDRQEKGKESEFSAVQEFERQYKIPVVATITLANIIEYLSENEKYSDILEKIFQYQAEYGV